MVSGGSLTLMNKKALAIPVGILTVMVILLVVYTSYYVLTREENIRKKVDVSVMDKMYVSELELNFILENVFDKVSEDASIEEGESVFIEGFLKELKSHKVGGKYLVDGLQEVEDEIEESVEFVDVEKRIILSINVVLEKSGEDVKISYLYEKKFEKVFK